MINFSGAPRAARGGRASFFLAVLLVGCGGARAAEHDRPATTAAIAEIASDDRLWVLAPHPDDEVLMAGELLRDAVRRGRPYSVLVMTNGDLSCARNGHARQGESVEALAELGVPEDHVHFLGYPDGWLDALGPVPLDPLPRAAADGSCGVGDHTYAERGAFGVDVHTHEMGAPGPYVASGPVDDLVRLLERERPTEIVTAHGIDTHPDHARTYVLLRQAIDRAAIPPPRILRSIVHQGACWPNGSGQEPCPPIPTTQGTPFPAFAPPLDAYSPTLRIPSDDAGRTLRASIAHYTSQLGTPVAEESWLSSFARTDEMFWAEDLVRRGDAGRAVDVDLPAFSHEHPLLTRTGDLALEHLAPFVLRTRAHLEAVDGSVGIALLGEEEGNRLSLTLDRDGMTLRHGTAALVRIPVPHGEDALAPHDWELSVLPRPASGPVAEVTIRRDGVYWGLAVIAAPESGHFGGHQLHIHTERGALESPTLVE